MDEKLQTLLARTDACGFRQKGVLPTSEIGFYDEVRELCRKNSCGKYAQNWACPPSFGTVDECRETCLKYDKIVLVNGVFDLEDSFDIEGMQNAMHSFKKRMDRLFDIARELYPACLMMSNEGCSRCARCTYPDAPCRFPDRLFHPIEGYGINVYEISKKAGMNYINGKNTVTYFGAVLI